MNLDVTVEGNIITIEREEFALQPLLAILRHGRRESGIWDDPDFCSVPDGANILDDQILLEIIERVSLES